LEGDAARPASRTSAPTDPAEARHLTRGLALAVLLGVLLGACLLSFAVRFVRVEGSSMAPALRDGDVVVVLLRPVVVREIRPGDVVLAQVRPSHGVDGQQVIKRVARRLDGSGGPHYVLRGDRRGVSRDSRQFGPIPISRVLGRAWLVLPREAPWRLGVVGDQRPGSVSDGGSATGRGPAPAGR
jgi:signal peptidase I